jgi:hypothetical protein
MTRGLGDTETWGIDLHVSPSPWLRVIPSPGLDFPVSASFSEYKKPTLSLFEEELARCESFFHRG